MLVRREIFKGSSRRDPVCKCFDLFRSLDAASPAIRVSAPTVVLRSVSGLLLLMLRDSLRERSPKR